MHTTGDRAPIDTSLLLRRYEANAAMIPRLFADVPDARMREERTPGKWSAHANLAHLGQFHDVIEERTKLMLRDDNPRFARFAPPEDPRTQEWIDLPRAEMHARFAVRRREMIATLEALTPQQWARPGTSLAFGTLRLDEWLEFWLQHEGHHVVVAMVVART